MSNNLKNGIPEKISGLKERIKTLESQLSRQNQNEDKKNFEIWTNSAIAELSYSLVTSNASLPGIANIVLNYAKVFTNSDIGYVSSIDPKTGNNICHTLTGMIGDSCGIVENEKGIVFPIGTDGKYPALWGHSLNTKCAFYTNTPNSHPASVGRPEGHFPLKNFLSVPAIFGSELYGQISLANALIGYTDYELKGVKRLAAIYTLAIQREAEKIKLNKEIEKRKRFQNKIKEIKKKTVYNSEDLEEANTALKALLKQRGVEQKETEKKIILNVNNLVQPYLDKLEKTSLNSRQQVYVEIVKNNLDAITSPFIAKAKSMNVHLTPQEIQISSLIRSGHQTKDISSLLKISINSVNFHRKNIRTKFGLKNKRANLRSYLLSFVKL